MVAILTEDGPVTRFSFPIEKAKTEVDPKTGDVIVYGKATDCTVDTDDQIVDERWASHAIPDWLKSGGNVRVQHNPLRDPAGVGIEAHPDGKGGQWVRARIFEPIAKILVLGGALRAFSIGVMYPQVVPDAIAKNGRIVGGIIGEISLVDRPANKNCDIEYQLAKAAKNGLPAWVGKILGDPSTFLTKAGSISAGTLGNDTDSDTVTVDLPRGAAISVTPADLAKMQTLARQNAIEKRDFDPGVGGGVDRDKLPASDFAGPDRTYPIVTPDDVKDAGGLIGHADDPEGVKRRVISIAHRKGPEFVAKIPDSWKKDSEEKAMDEPEVVKAGAKKCPKCGKNFHADSKLRNCDSCGADLPHGDSDAAEKAAKPDNGDGGKGDGQDDGDGGSGKPDHSDNDDDGDDDPDDGGGDTDDDNLATKGAGMACTKCGMGMKAKHKFCPGCGTAAVGKPDLAKKGLKKSRNKPTPAEGVKGDPSPAAQPVPAHREPDGQAVEAFEADASLPTDPDTAFKTAMRQRGLGVTDNLGALHDLLCPAFHPATADQAHPGFALKGMDLTDWQLKAFDAATSAPFEEAERATKRWQHASTISGATEDVIAELRHEAHAAFKAMNPGVGSAPTPSSITPGQFKRAYLTDGRARPSFQQQGPNTSPMISGQISANDYHRSLILDGRADDSPANKGMNADLGLGIPGAPGELTRVQYAGAMKANTAYAMDVLHAHVAQTFPDLCPMGPSHEVGGTGGPVGGMPDKRPVPAPVGKGAAAPETAKSASSAAATEAPTTSGESTSQEQLEAVKAALPALLKAALSEALAPLTSELAETKTELKAQRKINKRLQQTVDALANQTDPTSAPWRGHAQPGAIKSFGQPVAEPSPADIATRANLMVQQELEHQAYDDPDPRRRELAYNALLGLRGMR